MAESQKIYFSACIQAHGLNDHRKISQQLANSAPTLLAAKLALWMEGSDFKFICKIEPKV